jgi:hypothetical protein
MHVKAAGCLSSQCHRACSKSLCKILCLGDLDLHLKLYLDELDRVFFKKENQRNRESWWLSAFYSFCIQGIVRRALIELTNAQTTGGNTNGVVEYLHLAIRLFVASSSTYDPLIQNLAPDRALQSTDSFTTADREHYKTAQLAVQQADWAWDGIYSTADFLKQLFGDDGSVLKELGPESNSLGEVSLQINNRDTAEPYSYGIPERWRRPTNRDEFDGPHQFLPRPPPESIAEQDRDLPKLPTNLVVQEQDLILNQVNDRLSQCAFDFVAKYEFPIPIDSHMRLVERPEDREWAEWVYLLKRLATKRRIPARFLYNGQIKQLVTILENSLEIRPAVKKESRPLKDDRNILQFISAGIQVAKILKDASAMEYLDRLYVRTWETIQARKL